MLTRKEAKRLAHAVATVCAIVAVHEELQGILGEGVEVSDKDLERVQDALDELSSQHWRRSFGRPKWDSELHHIVQRMGHGAD